ncbi:MAG TPA: 3-isopropylmalate dehydrogenase [Rhodospirillaceae bacterium]|nr:3-isopropylmalate dehydrogenase [Alphaproteobacteria bacterium]HBH26673.1 3-isopropylmalate dehydrogenase [Rhodospirillaceae bacterium]
MGRVVLLPGDGIGPEIMAEAEKVIAALGGDIAVQHGLVGGASIAAHGVPLTDETLAQARAADAVLLACVGGPRWTNVAYDKRPEAGLLRLRKDLDLFANLRPAIVFDALVDASTLKPDIVRGLDILIVRELTGGVYFGQPRGVETLPDGQRRGVNTHVYTSGEITRLGHVAFDLARKRRSKVTSCEKSNVMEAGLLWREEMAALHAAEYPDVTLEHMLADNCAMQLLRNPSQFDVIATDNLFGDMLSDEAAMLTGSLGMLPSASLGAPGAPGLYEPVHGSAPDIAGRGVANPCAMILSLAMALRYSLGLPEAADRVEAAVQGALDGARTPDIAADGIPVVSTAQMGDAVVARL